MFVGALVGAAAVKVGVPVLIGVGAVAAAPIVLGAAGFTAGGVAAGSLAAAIQVNSVFVTVKL